MEHTVEGRQKTSKPMSERKLLGIVGTGWLFDAMDVGILSFIITALTLDWGLSSQQAGWIGSVNSIGMAVGAFVFGIMADKIGRRTVFMITILIFSICSGLSALAASYLIFIVLRFFIGAGLGGELPVASTLVSESVAPERRGRMVVLLESFWAVGWLAAAIISYFVIPAFGWRVALLLTAIPALFAVLLRKNLPDSPSYTNLKEKKSAAAGIRQLLAKGFAKRSAMLWIVWFCIMLSYYGMFLWLPSVMVEKGFDMVRSFEYVMIMTLAQLPGYFSAAWLIEKVGRKPILIIYLIGTAISAVLFGNAESAAMLLTSGMLLSFFNLGAYGILYAYTPEQYPTAVRATGSGVAATAGRIGGILGPLLIGYRGTLGLSVSAVFLLFCVTVLIAAAAVWLLGEETKGKTLA
ncbi:MFS transporter, putative metabolite:H+ symporter [Terribacillus aidingensis]|uniref:MFS transporter, putative metabolite:H+ symporter n=1 Tax=Terribacillus aidingensis TaxID=586416 RepID=A0A285P8U5_9BACI|nr:MFS transporter [Terribacillus aidingensis]SNZ17623.1 MFS transporter, putative metabolite:H+ symporter [Terribacillus aidingensis]